MMRVAYVCADPGVPVWGRKGCSIHVQEVLRALARRGARVTLFATRFDGEPPADLESIRACPLPPLPKGDLAGREQNALAANGALRDALEREGPFGLVYERYSLWSFAGMSWARESGTPSVLEVNAPLIEEQAEHRGLVDRAGAEEVAARVFADASAVCAVSQAVARWAKYLGAHGERVHVLPNGVNPDRFSPGGEGSLPAPDVFTVGFVGNTRPWHGLPRLLEAFAILHRRDAKTRLLVVGGGEIEGAVQEARALGLGQAAHFCGPVEPREVPALLASMDVGVAPYPEMPEFYFSPLKVYEYMAAGLPVVASRVGELPELIRHGENGLLCAPGSPQVLADALDRLRRDPELRRAMGRAAREQVLRCHTWDAVVERALGFAGLDSAMAAGEAR